MDKIFIHELKIETIIGCLAWERQVKQPVILDLEIDYDLKSAGLSDDLNQTIDYHLLAQTLTGFIQNSQFKLIEALAEQAAKLMLETFSLNRVVLKVTKFSAVPQAKSVSVSIVRP